MPNLEVLLELFEEDLVQRDSSPHTIRAYVADLRRFRDHFARPGAELTVAEFDGVEFDVSKMHNWLQGLIDAGFGEATICRNIAAVRAFFEFAKVRGMIEVNPAIGLRRPIVPKAQRDVLSEKQADEIIAGVESLDRKTWRRDRAMLELLHGCGLRVSELVGLNVQDIDRTRCILRVNGKGPKDREVPYGDKVSKALEEYLAARNAVDGEDAVFANIRGIRLTDRSARIIVKAYGVALAGTDSIHPHSFRQALAVNRLERGDSPRMIQKLLGYESNRTTERYS